MSEPMELTYRQFDSFIDTAEENTPDNPYYIKITNNITGNIIDGVDREIYYKLIINKTETTSGLPISFQANPNLVGLEVIGDNLSHSAERLCSNCKNLKSVKFGTSCILNNLYSAFSDCSNLISVELPYDCLQEIEDMEGTFAGCTSLKDIDFNILNYCPNINDAFSRCVSLSGEINLLFNRHPKYNLWDIFNGCENISAAQITVENSYLYGNVMFKNCYSLEKIDINLTESIVNIGMLGTVNDKYKNCKCDVVCNDTYSGTNIFYEFTDLKTQYGTGMTSLYRINIGSSDSNLKNLELSVFNESVNEVYFHSPLNNVSLNFNNIDNYRGASINFEHIAYVKKLSIYNAKALIYYEDLKDSNKNYYSYLEDLYFENCELNFSSFIMDHSNTSVKSFIGTGLRNYSFFPRFENFKSLKTVKANYRFVDDNNNLINTPALYIQYSFQECINLEEVLITCDNPELHVGVMDTFINCRSLTSFRFPPNAVSFSGENFSDGVGLKILEVTKGILSSQFIKYSLEQLNLEHLIVDMKNQAWDTNFNKFKLAPKITLKNLGGNDVAWKEKYNNKYIKLVVSSNSIQTFHTHVNSLTKDSFALCPNLKTLKLEGYLDQDSSINTDGDIRATGKVYSQDKPVVAADTTKATSNDPNDCLENGFYYIQGSTYPNKPPFPSTSSDYRLLVTAYNEKWLQQIATDYRSNQVYLRRCENGTWTSWAEIGGKDDTKLPLAGGTMTGAITFASGQTWPTFNQNTTGKANTAGTADKISSLTTTDKASSSSVKRRIWMCYSDNTNGRPAYDDNFTYETDIGELRSKQIKVDDNVTFKWNSTTKSLDFTF